jgi:hypothetical protein
MFGVYSKYVQQEQIPLGKEAQVSNRIMSTKKAGKFFRTLLNYINSYL